mgnify:FL=1
MKRKTLLQSFIVHNNRIKDFFRIMRISLFLLFVCVCQLMAVEAGAQSAEIKISQNSMTIRQLVKEIEAQTEYLVVFRDQDVDAERVVSFKTKSASVANYLEELSENANIGYRFDNNYITLVPRTTATAQNKKTVTGTIVDANGEPIIGANIVEKGTTNGTITDIDGNFTLEVSEKSILLVSFIGYAPQEVMVGSQQKINVKMKEDTEMLMKWSLSVMAHRKSQM